MLKLQSKLAGFLRVFLAFVAFWEGSGLPPPWDWASVKQAWPGWVWRQPATSGKMVGEPWYTATDSWTATGVCVTSWTSDHLNTQAFTLGLKVLCQEAQVLLLKVRTDKGLQGVRTTSYSYIFLFECSKFPWQEIFLFFPGQKGTHNCCQHRVSPTRQARALSMLFRPWCTWEK